MKRLVFALIFLFISSTVYAGTVTVDSLVSPDDITMSWLNKFKNTVVDVLNSFPGDNIQTGSITTASFNDNANPELRWGEAFNEFVYTGMLAPTSASLSSTTTAGTAYVREDSSLKMKRVVKDAIAHTYTASKDTYVDLSSSGTYTYNEVANGAAEPSTSANSIRLFKAVTSGVAVTSVSDMRVTGVQIATNEDYQLKGMELNWGNGDIISTDAGVAYVGSTRAKKASFTNLNLGTASDYINGASESGVSKLIYVYIDSSGNVKLDDNAPDYADTDGNASGKLRYFKNSSTYWRCLGAVRLDSSQKVLGFYQTNDEYYYDDSAVTTGELRVLNAGAATSFTDVDCSAVVPSFARAISFNATASGTTTTPISIRANGSNASNGTSLVSVGTNSDYNIVPLTPCDSSRIVEYKVGGGSASLRVRSYRIGIRD